jgi:glycosyltransferase involved in cell wall biosynthesis
VIHVGIEPQVYENAGARISPAKDAPPRLLCVAAHRPYKGLPFLIEACRILRDRGVSFQCDVVGGGPDTAKLEALVRENSVGDVFHLVGPRPQEDVTRMMAEATLFVLPSIIAADGQMEGIPVALMEAMATGRAVVSTSISGIPELVENGVNGLLVPHSNAPALADAIQSLLSDPERARQMGARGQQKVRAEFTLQHCVARLLELIDRENA